MLLPLSPFFDELEKIAITRWQKAIQSGELPVEEAGRRLGSDAALSSTPAFGPAYTRNARQKMWEGGTDLSDLNRHRELQGRMSNAQMRFTDQEMRNIPKIGPGMSNNRIHVSPDSGTLMRELSEGKKLSPILRMNNAGELLPPAIKNRLMPAGKPVDKSLLNAVTAHEFGELALSRGVDQAAYGGPLGVPLRSTSSHLGALPLLEEAHAVHRDPEAQKIMGKVRALDPDDKFVTKKMRQFGHTPNAPLPMGGKAHSKLENLVGDYTPRSPMAVQKRVMQHMGGVPAHGLNMSRKSLQGRLLDTTTNTIGKVWPQHEGISGSANKAFFDKVAPTKNIGQKIMGLRALARK